MTYKTDRARVSGLGSAKEGVGHWWSQRITSVAMAPLTLLFIFPFARALGSSYEEARAIYSSPFNAIVAILFLGVGFYHLMQGLQVVIEDYVPNKPVRTAAILFNTLICWALAAAGIFAVAKIAFAG